MISQSTDRPFVCSYPGCHYRGKTSSQLSQHRASHGIGYVYACEFCDYRATTSTNLRRHSRLHMDTRPYRCPHCSHTFVELSALRRHVLDSAYHPGLPLYVCPWCPGSSPATPTPPVASTAPSLIIDSPLSPPSASTNISTGVCGFNSSTLAWKHVVQAHADRLSDPETLRRLGRKPGDTFIEHDVSLVFGLYHPSEDGNFRPSSAVRQFNAVATARTHLRMRSSKNRRANSNNNNAATVATAVAANQRKRPPPNPPLAHSILTVGSAASASQSNGNSTSVYGDLEGGSGEPLKFIQMQDLVSLPGGALWSTSAFQSELIRVTGGGLTNEPPKSPSH